MRYKDVPECNLTFTFRRIAPGQVAQIATPKAIKPIGFLITVFLGQGCSTGT